MTDLVLLRELIKSETALGHIEEITRVFRRCDLDCLFGNMVDRTASPYPPVTIALCFNLLTVKKMRPCARAVTTESNFQEWHTERLNITLPIDAARPNCKALNSAMNRARVLDVRNVNKLQILEEGVVCTRTTSPLPLVLFEKLARVRNGAPSDTHRRKVIAPARSTKSPRAT